MEKRVNVIGCHPLVDDVCRQYAGMGWKTVRSDSFEEADWSSFADEWFIAFGEEETFSDDALMLAELVKLSGGITVPEGFRPVCHVLLHDDALLYIMRTENVFAELNGRFELCAFTMEDQWAKNLLCNASGEYRYPHPDRIPLMSDTRSAVHLVIDGFDDMGMALAINAALVCHYPNYVKDGSRRTRITCIDRDMEKKRDNFISRYVHLMDNSFYRFIDVDKEPMQTYFHQPMYITSREDFVDIEWEFVTGDIDSAPVRDKLRLWSSSPECLLTVYLCGNGDKGNMRKAMGLSALLAGTGVPVMVRQKSSLLPDEMRSAGDGLYSGVHAFGMTDRGYDVTLPLHRQAKLLNYFYNYSYSFGKLPTSMPREEVEEQWRKIEFVAQRYSNICNVMCIPVKMRSVGHDENDNEHFYALDSKEIKLLSEVEHNRWSVERLILGYRPADVLEREEIRKSIEECIRTGSGEDLKKLYKRHHVHYDICSFNELGVDKTGKDVRQYDVDLTTCIPLIVEESKHLK